MLASVAMAGGAAGIVATPMLLWITALFAGLLLLSARREAGDTAHRRSPTQNASWLVDAERRAAQHPRRASPRGPREACCRTSPGWVRHSTASFGGRARFPWLGPVLNESLSIASAWPRRTWHTSMPAWPDSSSSTSVSPPQPPGWMGRASPLRARPRRAGAAAARGDDRARPAPGSVGRPRPRSVGAVRLDRRASDRGGRPRRRRRGDRGTARPLAVRRGGNRTPVERRASPGRYRRSGRKPTWRGRKQGRS